MTALNAVITGMMDPQQAVAGPSQMQPQTGPVAPTTGVIGSEQALGQAGNILGQAGAQAVGDIQAGTSAAMQNINTASGQAQQALASGLAGAEQPLAGYAGAGQGANALQAALLGASGPAAQAQAMQNFQQSPGQDFLREQQERAVLRNAAATGGTQGGNVLEELQRRAFGRANTSFNDRISQLSGLGAQGLQAGGQISGLRQMGATGQAGILGDTGMALSGLNERLGGNLASTRLGIGGQQAGLQSQIAGGRTRAGELLSQNIAGTTANLADLQSQQGAGLSDLLGGADLASIFQTAGITDASTQQQLAAILANIATQQGSQAGSLPGIPGVQETEGLIPRLMGSLPG